MSVMATRNACSQCGAVPGSTRCCRCRRPPAAAAKPPAAPAALLHADALLWHFTLDPPRIWCLQVVSCKATMRAHLLLATLAACAAAAAALNLSAGQRCANTGARKAALQLLLLLTRTAILRNR